MHSESKLTNHGKVSSNGGQSQPPNVSQGSKGPGLQGPKANHMSPSSSGLKSGQSQGPNLGTGQREPGGDVGEQREPGAPSLEPEPKGDVPPRSKRRCVLERKQLYSGDEWCSGPESEEDEKSLVPSHNYNAGDSVMSAPALPGSGSASLPGLNDSSSSSTQHGAGPSHRGDGDGPGAPSKMPSQFVYVFTTYLANTAADAVLQGQADSILVYHQQNVPRAKLDEATLQKPSSAPDPRGATPRPSSPSPTPSKPIHQTPPAPSQAQPTVVQESGPEELNQRLTPSLMGNGSSRPASGHSNPPPQPTSQLPDENPVLRDTPPGNGATLNQEVLSREQLEHRERSLQTLRDIERLLLRSGAANESFQKHTPSPGEGPPPPPPPMPVNPSTPMKKYEEPLQSMITQTQSLGGSGLEQEIGGPQPGTEMGQQMSLMMQRLGQDSLTPEQAAWRKLQEEYYAEKRRKEEHMSIHGRPAPDMVLRGPPPPYHSKPGDWIGNRLAGALEGQDPTQLRAGGMTFQGPRFPGRYGAMQNLPVDAVGVMQRPARWVEEMPPLGSGQVGFSQSGLPYPGGGQGDVERFLNPRAREELLRQQLMEKRPVGLQRQLSVPSGQGIEMERMMMTHRQGDPSMFPGETMGGGPGMDFVGSRGMMSPSLGQQGRELDPTMGGGNLNMNMSVNMNMNLNLQMAPHQHMFLSQKMRSGGDLMGAQGNMGHEELMRAVRAQNGSGMPVGPQKMMLTNQFPQGQSAFPPGQGPYPNMQQEMVMDMFGSEHGSVEGTTRLSHMSMPSGPGANSTGVGPIHMTTNRSLSRRPTELTINVNQMGSPGMSHLKSPTLGQVNSPLVSSPLGNMKSPHTPGGQISGLPSSNAPGSLKSPQVMGSSISGRSPSGSPGRLKSPQMNIHSPGWASPSKGVMHSPGIPPGKQGMGMNPAASLGVIEQGVPSQNPLSLMMSQMSKYAMPSSTPLYHNAIKTIATSDDELLPERMLLPPGSQQGPGMNPPISLHLNMTSSQSPIGNISLSGQPSLSHEPSLLTSPGPPTHPAGGASMQNPLMMSQDTCCPGSQMMSSNQLVFPPRLQPGPPHNPSMSQSVVNSMQQHYSDDIPTQPRLPHRLSDHYVPGLPSVLSDPDLGEVIRPSASGIPEFDLSRIMPSEKPSSTLQYFPKGGVQGPKPHPTNMHLLGLQNMMVEQHQGRPGPSVPGQQRVGVPTMGRTGMAPPPQMTQQNFMLMKQRSVSGEMYPQNTHVLSPQGTLGGHLPGQQSMMVGHQMRQRSLSLDTYIPGPGHLPF
ncbi:B-cell CLL/lymphoma 9-like protein isoform 2-T2 [Discoglossus pictus]